MMKHAFLKSMAAALVLCMLVPTGAFAQKKKKEKKEKEPFQWVMPALSGDKDVDNYLLACDDCWNRTLAYTQSLTMYHIDTTYVKGDDGTVYKAFSLVDQNGEKRSTSKVIMQNIDLIFAGTDLTLTMTNVGLGMANASLALPNLGLKAISYGKYIGDGAKILGECGKEVGRIVQDKKAENAAIKAMKQNAVNVGEIKSTDKVILNRLDEGEDVPAGVDPAMLNDFDMGDNSEAVDIDEAALAEAEAKELE